jgi:hypothetical protein
MNADRIRTTARAAMLPLTLALIMAGCKSAPPAADDAALTTQVQARLFADQNLAGQAIQASVASGVVTLSGNVTSDTARTIASGDAAQVAGIKTVVDNLVVQTASPAAVSSQLTTPPPPAPTSPDKHKKPSASMPQLIQPQPAPIVRNAPEPQPIPQPAAPPIVAQAPPPPPPPPAPVAHNITLPAGTAIPVRITQTLDSASTQTGDKFTGAVASDIIEDGLVVLPQGTEVTGHVDAVQDAAHFKGSSLLTISLSAINHKGEHIEVSTEPYTKQGEGRGKNTAEKVGGGAAVGAILGGILGGGKGAAIGAAAGGGVGAGANTVTRGQQVQIASETVVRFKLSDPIMIHVNGSGSSGNSGPTLERHNNQ